MSQGELQLYSSLIHLLPRVVSSSLQIRRTLQDAPVSIPLAPHPTGPLSLVPSLPFAPAKHTSSPSTASLQKLTCFPSSTSPYYSLLPNSNPHQQILLLHEPQILHLELLSRRQRQREVEVADQLGHQLGHLQKADVAADAGAAADAELLFAHRGE
jgi:hypothetical protein